MRACVGIAGGGGQTCQVFFLSCIWQDVRLGMDEALQALQDAEAAKRAANRDLSDTEVPRCTSCCSAACCATDACLIVSSACSDLIYMSPIPPSIVIL